MTALRHATHAALLLWWLPAIALPALSRASFSYRARRASRLLEAGDLVEADRVIARLRWEAERCRRRVEERWHYSVAGDVDAS